MKTTNLLIEMILLSMLLLSNSCNKEKMCVVENYSLNDISPYYDGQWQGITVASDGSCYFGSSSHNLIHGGGFFKYDTLTNKLEVLTEDLTNLVGDDISKFTPQGKVHSPIIEVDGNLYMATHLAAYWKEVLNNYAGSYLLSYNIQSKKWTNYGITKNGFSTYSAIEIDKKRGKAYLMTVPFSPNDTAFGNHLFEVDLKSKEKRDLGRIGDGKACFYFFIDNSSRLWASVWKGKGSLYCYDPAVDSIKEYKNAFPEAKLYNDEKANQPPTFVEKAWTWLHPIENGEKCLFTMGDFGGGDERLWIFDPNENIESKNAFKPICYIGNTFLSVALGGNRVYFIQRASNAESRNYDAEGKRDEPANKSGHHVSNLHLKSVSLDPKCGYKIIDHGRLIDKKGRTAAYIGSLAADEKGNVYMSGGWLIAEGDQPTLQYVHKSSDGKAYKALEGPGQDAKEYDNQMTVKSDENFIPLKRAEFFSRVNVLQDL